MKGGASGEPAIVAGKPEQSYLIELVTSDDAEVRMPKEQKRLAAAEVELLRRWIGEGAAFDAPDEAASLDSYVPKQVQPCRPRFTQGQSPLLRLPSHPMVPCWATGGYHEVIFWNVSPSAVGSAPPVLLRRINNVAQRTHSIAFNPDGSLMAVAAGTPGRMGEVKLFNPQTGELVAELRGHPMRCLTSSFRSMVRGWPLA